MKIQVRGEAVGMPVAQWAEILGLVEDVRLRVWLCGPDTVCIIHPHDIVGVQLVPDLYISVEVSKAGWTTRG